MHVAGWTTACAAVLAAQCLQPVLQLEHAHQVARRAVWNSCAMELRLGVVGRAAAGAVLRPQVDDGVGRRVMLARARAPRPAAAAPA